MMTGCTDKVFVICDISNLIYLLNCSHVLFDKLHSELAMWLVSSVPEICIKYFLSFPLKNLSPEKTECLLFGFWMIKFTVIPKKTIWQCGKIGALVNFIAQKLKSKQLVYLSFLWWQVFLRERSERKYFTHISVLW